jgi:hypothetical protein
MKFSNVIAAGIFAVLIWAVPALAQQNDTDRSTWVKYQEIGAMTNCDDAAINGAVTCGGTRGVRVEGYSTLTFEIAYTYSAGTGWEFYLETCYEGQATTDCTDAADWHRVAVQEPAPSQVELTPGRVFRSVAADDQLTWSINVNYKRVRLGAFVATGSPDAGDKITVNLRISGKPVG